ncbi:DUF6034 family protein [Eubacteriales bacterium OttesenSCG-928-K08]|nr:DUF6034 family protein [Eubacteriales bacterium OttesenSCG-928-K08]
MKRLLFALLSLLLLLCACQKTPESPIVVGKNTEQMLEAAQREDKGNTDEESIDLYARLGAPKEYTAELVSKKEKLLVQVGAQVLLPDCELPIVRVQPAEFTLDQARHFAKVLLGADANYIDYDFGDETHTKAVYARKIEKLRAGIANWDQVGQYVFDLQYYTVEEAEQALSALLVKAADAPERLPAIMPDFAWSMPQVFTEDGEVQTTDTNLYLCAMPDDAIYSSLDIGNNLEYAGYSDVTYQRDTFIPVSTMGSRTQDVTGLLQTTEAEAYMMAEATVRALGLEGFVCSASQQTLYDHIRVDPPAFYHFMFTRQINGAVETYTNASESNSVYSSPWHYEKIHILIDDSGILLLNYHSPYELLETVMEETELLPFTQIQAIFEKMVVIVNNEVDDNAVWDESGKLLYTITSVRLGLMSIPEKNKNTGLLVPVWDFMGYSKGRMDATHDWGYGSTNELHSFLTINAIDGSIIER